MSSWDDNSNPFATAASNPAVQQAAVNAASNPAVQQAAVNAAYNAASNPAVQQAVYNAASNPTVQQNAVNYSQQYVAQNQGCCSLNKEYFLSKEGILKLVAIVSTKY